GCFWWGWCRLFVVVDARVFVGKLGALVREGLGEKALERAGEGRGGNAYTASNEQGFALRRHGYTDRF
ncbi:type I-E CRISPR-associated endoribonuclease Cas2, partial [Thermus scotoductus]|uniref:type I-E CRISPR-associated endoribonuclease Cas2 n=1 Tax=Thermus scotoductus TaxID=37636 RepID=UPI0020A3AF6F